MRVIRWKNSATGVESLNITATGIYFPVGKEDGAFVARYVMAAGGQTASIEDVRSPAGDRVGNPSISVSGTTEVIARNRRSLAYGIAVTAISGTLTATLDDLVVRTNWPDNLGRFAAKGDADAYTYGGTGLDGCGATISGVPSVYRGPGVGWVALIGPKTPSVLMFGDSISSPSNQGSWFELLMLKSGGAYTRAGNAAIQGYTTQQIIDSVPAALLAYPNADELWVEAGTNDALQLSLPVSQHIALLRTLLSTLLVTGKKVLLFAIPPMDGNKSLVSQYRQASSMLARSLGIMCFDLWSRTINPSDGGYLASMTGDGTHPSPLGFATAVQDGAALLGARNPASSQLLPVRNELGAGLISNPLFVTDANSDGLADGFSITGGPVSTNELVASEYGNKQHVVITNLTSQMSLQPATTLSVTTACRKICVVGKLLFSGTASKKVSITFTKSSGTIITGKHQAFGCGGSTADGIISSYIDVPEETTAVRVEIVAYGLVGQTADLAVERFQVYDVTALGV